MVVCGIDEAGRGPIAGPVCAAAVILGPGFDRTPLKDSKVLSPAARNRIAAVLLRDAAVGVGWSWPEEIDRLNIHHASLLAMQRAYEALALSTPLKTAGKALVDGKFTPPLPIPAEAIVKGDAKIPEISAASIVAKVARDRWMIRYSWIEPDWAFETHKGYPTAAHRDLCRRYGLSPIHRRSFKIF